MSRAARTLVVAAVVLAVPAAACTVLLGSKDVPTPDDAGGDATIDGGADGGRDALGDMRPGESASDDGGDAGDSGSEECAPVSSTRCEGKLPEVCGANGLWHEAGAACEYVCDDGGCTGQCSPTSQQCVGLDPETCTAEGLWEAGSACPFLCDAGICTGSCTPNTVQCGTAPVGDSGSTTTSVNTCNSKGQLNSVPCVQPTPDCAQVAGAPTCTCTGSMCGVACAHLQTDPGNCGTCGHDCLGGTCVGGACQPSVLVSNQQDPYDIAIDGTNVYWVDNIATIGTVNACALTGCNNTPTVLASGQSGPTGITVNAGVVYWVNIGMGVNGGSVMSCPAGGCAGTPTPLATNLNAPTAIAVAAGNAYFTGSSGTMKCATASCTPTAFGPGGSDIVVDGTNAYWTATGGPVRCALGGCGGTPTAIATGQLSPWAIAVDGSNVYWSNLSGHTVALCLIAGGCNGNPTEVSPATRPNDVAVDATNVYWVDFTTNTISSCAIAGCSNKPTILASGQMSPNALAVDTTAIYWVNENPGAVMKLAK